jgi:GTP cyclohydrolase I
MTMTDITHITWETVRAEAHKIADRHRGAHVTDVYGIPTGGAPVAIMVADALAVPVAESPTPGNSLIVDDLVDTGRTMAQYRKSGYRCDAMFRKSYSPADLAPDATVTDGWLAFPWEKDDGDPTDAVLRLIQHVGEDPTREGLLDTPRRVTKAWRELTSGYHDDPETILSTTFDVAYDQMVLVRNLPFVSLCEHHILPFTGTATIAYVPGDRVVGLSKLARLLDCYSRRLQVQERLTNEIADAIEKYLAPQGVGVVVSGTHSCMALRGVRKTGDMVTSAMRGVIRTNDAARAELMALHR